MAFGYECDKGWYPLIDELIEKLEQFTKVSDKSKFLTWIYKIFKVYDFQILQIKEKFGGLRVYISNETDERFNLIQEYEEKSYKTCEICGSTSGAMCRVNGGWYKTVCRKHAKEFGYKRIKKRT